MEQVHTLLSREPRPLPKLKLNPEIKNIFDFKYEDIQIIGYDPHPVIKAEVAV
jgi:thymidylate synthase